MDKNNIEKLNKVGLIENNQKNELYNELVQFYKKSIEIYLDKILNLSEIENEFLSKINYPIIPSNEFIKQFEVNSIWKIFYLKNEIFLERLSEEELLNLKKAYELKSIDINFIKNTYQRVTKYYENYPNNYYVHYPHTYEDTYVMNNSLFLLIIVDIFQNQINNFQEFYFDVMNKLNDLQERLKTLGKNINLEVKYIYN